MTNIEQKKNADPLDVYLAIRLEILAGIRGNIGSKVKAAPPSNQAHRQESSEGHLPELCPDIAYSGQSSECGRGNHFSP
jgi:hypothetical protein